MAFDATRVLSSRDYKVYLVPWNTTNTVPADTVVYGSAWGAPAGQSSPWVETGYVDGGLHFTTTVDRGEVRVDQELDPILRPATGRDARMSTNLAEIKAANIKNATGQGTVTTVAATTAARGHDDWDLDSSIQTLYTSIGFDIQHPGDNEAFRMAGWKGQVLGSPTFDVVPGDKLVIPLELALLPDTSTTPPRIMKVRDVIAVGGT